MDSQAAGWNSPVSKHGVSGGLLIKPKPKSQPSSCHAKLGLNKPAPNCWCNCWRSLVPGLFGCRWFRKGNATDWINRTVFYRYVNFRISQSHRQLRRMLFSGECGWDTAVVVVDHLTLLLMTTPAKTVAGTCRYICIFALALSASPSHTHKGFDLARFIDTLARPVLFSVRKDHWGTGGSQSQLSVVIGKPNRSVHQLIIPILWFMEQIGDRRQP